ncbi:protein kinase (macronuclear) [Tetrahymena thermophila SB210]|uniref:Protein kinase n=1 Tax=Tetrahymena thermophila (strain SB210) TaxID=312017 RepID=I7LXW3_TETTS|nr:protein kinase [Tetrahymena thermophila SB210]EAS06313.2 protein kinase [Tetrahymena thermophila SB210]|eukprot:XP_001026558.2 protein kinase [Tetrahymena thermophila SB210]
MAQKVQRTFIKKVNFVQNDGDDQLNVQTDHKMTNSQQDQQQMQSNNYLFATGFLLLILLYLLVSIYIATKLKKQRKSVKVMYGTLLLYLLIRFFSFNICMLDSINIIEISNASIVYHLAMNSIFLCDCIFVISFFALFRFFLMFKYYSHISLSSTWETKILQNQKVLLYAISIFISVQIVIVILFNTPIIRIQELMIDDFIQNILIIICYVVFHVLMVFKFSGTPYLSNHLKKNTRIIMAFTFYFALSRSVIAAVNIYLSQNQNGVFDLIQSPSNTLIWKQFMLIASLIFTEIIPFAALASRSNIFQEKFQEPLLPQDKVEEGVNKEAPSINSVRTYSEEMNNFELAGDISKVKLQENEKGETISYYRHHGLGKIFHSCDNKAIRKIEVKQLSQYIIDEIKSDVYQQKQFPAKKLVRVLEYQCLADQLLLAYPFYNNRSLRYIIQKQSVGILNIQSQCNKETFTSSQTNETSQFTLASKVNLALKIAYLIRDMHHQGFIHGHLHSDNILLSSKLYPRIADLGLNALKKYLGLKGQYSNKSQFTSPENLLARGPVVSTNDPASDTYSFAFILYELFVGREPFQNVSLKELKEIVVEKESRPKIPSEIPEEIQKLIRCCWYQRAQDRPDFESICEHLENYSKSQQILHSEMHEHDQNKSQLK